MKWTSSNKKVATVNSSGKITAKSLGKSIITAKCNGISRKCSVKVDTASAKVLKNSTISLKSYIKNIPGHNSAKWSSNKKSVATVSSSGKVTGKGPGTATITANIKGVKYKINVTVKRKVSCTVTYVDPDNIYSNCGIKFTNNTKKKITYITFNIKQYDNRGYRLESPYDYYYWNHAVYPNSYDEGEYWVHEDCRYAKAYITKVWFSDGTTWTP